MFMWNIRYIMLCHSQWRYSRRDSLVVINARPRERASYGGREFRIPKLALEAGDQTL